MSNISNRHIVELFTASKSIPLTGQRLAKALWKSREGKNGKEDKKALYPSICVSLPMIKEVSEDQMDRLLPHLLTLIEQTQDKIVKSLFESSGGKLLGGSIGEEDIGIGAIISYLDAEQSGGRLNKEMIAEWFSEYLSDNLTAMIGEKIGADSGSDEDVDKINPHLNSYKEIFCSLAGGATVLGDKQINGCKNALALVGEEGCSGVGADIYKKLMDRLVRMQDKREVVKDLLEL